MNVTPFRAKAITQYLLKKGIALAAVGPVVILAAVFATFLLQHSADAGGTGDWSSYMFNSGRSGYNKVETIINRTSAPNLKVHWTANAGGAIFSQPVTAAGVIYWGSYDGYERATNLNGQQLWATNVGHRTTCAPVNPFGVVSTAAVVNGVVYVGGGDDYLYALNASNGSVMWHTPIGNPSTNSFIWDSPLVYNNNVYIGVATTGEAARCKLVPGAFFQLSASHGAILHTYNPVPPGCVGAGIWASPALDTSDGSVYFTTGTEGHCAKTNAIGLVKLRLSDLSLISSWVIPPADRVIDSDFGTTPTLFIATINGTSHKMVGVANKNGVYYAFDRAALSSGPLWSRTIALGGPCPQCGQGSISSSVFDGAKLYVAGGRTTINGANCKGSLRALDPANGSFLWETCLGGTVLGAVSLASGVIAVVDGPALTLVNSDSGAILYDNKNHFFGSPSISNGQLYVGSTTDQLYALGT